MATICSRFVSVLHIVIMVKSEEGRRGQIYDAVRLEADLHRRKRKCMICKISMNPCRSSFGTRRGRDKGNRDSAAEAEKMGSMDG